MAKKESTLGNMLFALFVITFCASLALSMVYSLTKAPIAAAMMARTNNAIMEVIPDFDNVPSEEAYQVSIGGGDTLIFYPGRKDGELVGTAIESFTRNGFSGLIKVMVGVMPDGTIHDVMTISHAETPGLGDKIEKRKSDWTTDWFSGRDPRDFNLAIRQDGGEVDAITASTITSRAFSEAVMRAWDAYMNYKESN